MTKKKEDSPKGWEIVLLLIFTVLAAIGAIAILIAVANGPEKKVDLVVKDENRVGVKVVHDFNNRFDLVICIPSGVRVYSTEQCAYANARYEERLAELRKESKNRTLEYCSDWCKQQDKGGDE